MAYCPNCGQQVVQLGAACAACGQGGPAGPGSAGGPAAADTALSSRGEDEQYCRTCRASVKRTAAVCLSCGSLTNFGGLPQPYGAYPQRASRNKTTAVLLAVFLSFWTWLYTFDRDSTKFWIGLGVNIVGVVFIFFFGLGILIDLGIWIWAIVDVASKPNEFYQNYSIAPL